MILQHDHPVLHWDFMLEAGDVLRTWRLLEEPGVGKNVRAEQIADHRLAYLDYEGPVSGNRGHVARWDAGTYAMLFESDEGVRVELSGSKFDGEVVVADGTAIFAAPAN